MGRQNWDDEMFCRKILNLKDRGKDKGGAGGDKRKRQEKAAFYWCQHQS